MSKSFPESLMRSSIFNLHRIVFFFFFFKAKCSAVACMRTRVQTEDQRDNLLPPDTRSHHANRAINNANAPTAANSISRC